MKESNVITTLSQLIAAVESGNNKWAIRFEPQFHPSADSIRKIVANNQPCAMSFATAETLCASSWGLYQIMGENLMQLGFAGNWLSYFQDEAIQETYFHKYCQARQIDFALGDVLNDQDKRDTFARKYNGSIAYGARMLQVYAACQRANPA